ncbi:MAG TPA: energy transducer TonB, partial [Desulfurivibrionaceae bacterium]|nr:energy transducer TonB [Desulfurivibrionaceae bacterium]
TYRSTPVRPAKEVPEKLAALREDLAASPTAPASVSPTPAQLEAQAAYVGRLNEHLRRHWKLPPLQDWDEKLKATIVIRTKRDGTVTATWFEKNSGNSRFDQYVKKAVANASPLPPLPPEFTQNNEEIGVTFTPGGLK